MTSIERSNTELRGALILAGLRIQQLAPHHQDDPVLAELGRVLRNAYGATKENPTGKRRSGLSKRPTKRADSGGRFVHIG